MVPHLFIASVTATTDDGQPPRTFTFTRQAVLATRVLGGDAVGIEPFQCEAGEAEVRIVPNGAEVSLSDFALDGYDGEQDEFFADMGRLGWRYAPLAPLYPLQEVLERIQIDPSLTFVSGVGCDEWYECDATEVALVMKMNGQQSVMKVDADGKIVLA